MFNRKSGCAILPAGLAATVAGVVVAISLAACRSDDMKRETAADGFVSTAANVAGDSGNASDAVDATQALPAESRHFAVYSVYRALFDEPVTETSGTSDIIGNSMMESATSISAERTVQMAPTCSMRALIMQD
ncbi:hypothetical protein [Herbaspirillum sp. ST 5-3]|uniref:hypothetical protein n=1 Tax=Oxalobacteraceae TaxID=75682 RepID=UPI0010A571E8|nr:hypothetical protein [Herbaspirillum sp. ST 5-3]